VILIGGRRRCIRSLLWLVDSSFTSGTSVRLDVSMILLFATLTDGPVFDVSAVRFGCVIEIVPCCACVDGGGAVC
jgi:hypothetical protein